MKNEKTIGLNKSIKRLFLVQLFCQAICAVISVYPIILIRDIVDLAVYEKYQNISSIIYIGCFYLVIQMFHGLLLAFTKYLSGRIQAKVSFTMEKRIFQHISKVSLQSIRFSDTTKLSSILVQDTQFISEHMVTSFGELVSAVLSFVCGFYFVSTIHRYMAFIVLPLGLISSLIIRWISNISYKNLLEQRENNTKLWKIFYEGIQGFIPLRFHNAMIKYSEKIEEQGKCLEATTIKQGGIESISYFATTTLFMATIGLIMIAAAIFVVRGSLTLGGLTAIMMYNHMLSDPLIRLQEINHNMQRLRVSYARILDILSLPEEPEQEKGGIDEIELTGVSYWIDGRKILDNENFHIFRGQSVVIMGSTGTGKTTMANLLAGIYQCTEGNVLFREHTYQSQKKPKISYMLQDEYIFDDTIYQNILVGNQKLSENTLKVIISICELEDVIVSHEGPVGENGIRLSGGERKRVLIARTIADFDSDLFIFDEMSASLDQDTFIRIWHKVDRYLGEKIRIYIEHNQSIQKQVDCVIGRDGRFNFADLHN